MIAHWALPGPARTLADICARVAAGEHIVIRGAPDFELRLALEPHLAQHQRFLHPVFDDPVFSPSAVLWREHCSWHAPEEPDPSFDELATSLGRDTWWIENILPDRASSWSSFLLTFAAAVRNVAPNSRPTVILCLPDIALHPKGFTIVEQPPPHITCADLAVAAHYATADSPDDLLRAVRVALAIEIAARKLPEFGALEELYKWLDAPATVLTDAASLVAYAAGTISNPEACLLLWRAQAGPLTLAIDRARCEILHAYATSWQLPYMRPPERPFPGAVFSPYQLELSDLIDQLAYPPPALADLLVRLKDLRRARNNLSHLRPVPSATFQLLSQPPP